jgi:hypothetical protein
MSEALERYRVLKFRNVRYSRNEDKAHKRKSKHGIRDGSTVLQISTTTVLQAGRADSLDLFEIRHCGELRSNICSLATGFANCRPHPSRRLHYSNMSGRQATHVGQPMNSTFFNVPVNISI